MLMIYPYDIQLQLDKLIRLLFKYCCCCVFLKLFLQPKSSVRYSYVNHNVILNIKFSYNFVMYVINIIIVGVVVFNSCKILIV